jgi:hypothetical protein
VPQSGGVVFTPFSFLLSPFSYLLSPFSLLLFLTGCMTMPKVDMSALKPAGPVASVVAAWEPAVSSGEKPMRGFGGRVYFYDQDLTRPVKADGTVVVYAFDEEGRSPWDSKPTEGFVFDEKTLNSKGIYKKSKIGHSYNLWIPWDAAGPEGQAKKISLIVRYIPKQGASVVSSQATAYLPGRHTPELLAGYVERREDGTIQQTSALRSATERPLPQRTRLTEERVIESNANRPQTLQSVIIR